MEKFTQLPKEALSIAFTKLFGNEWKENWPDESKAQEMKSILKGGTMPCRPIQNWADCIDYLRSN